MTYYHTTTFERREISDEIMQAWQAAGNPKAAQWAVLPDAPAYDAATQHAPEWSDGDWVVRDKTPEELAAETARLYPDAPMWQVKVWMVRNGIDLASIPSIMAASIPAGPQLQEALVRWETAPLVPYDNALVGLIAGALKVSKEVAWSEIRAI